MKALQITLAILLALSSCSKEDDDTVDPTTETNLPAGLVLKTIPAQTFTMGNNNLQGSPSQLLANPEHQVTLDEFEMGETEVTNAQYVEFLNNAFADGLLEITTGTLGPNNGKKLITGTASSNFDGKTLYTLEGTRVLKDHDNNDGDGDSFTGEIEPENPLNISYIGFNETINSFYVKDPFNVEDFNWLDVCNYQDYSTTPQEFTGPVLNDFDDWAGAGNSLSNELQDWTSTNPNGATNLPSQADVSNYPVTFITWYGAKAFAEYYELNLPTEAQWECAAKAGQNYEYAVHDGADISNVNWNDLGVGTVALGHVWDAKNGNPNPYGLYNLAGNAWEWMADNYTEPLSTDDVANPLIEVAGSASRCWRGGSWNYHQQTLQSSIRFYDQEDKGNDHFGFRIVKNN